MVDAAALGRLLDQAGRIGTFNENRRAAGGRARPPAYAAPPRMVVWLPSALRTGADPALKKVTIMSRDLLESLFGLLFGDRPRPRNSRCYFRDRLWWHWRFCEGLSLTGVVERWDVLSVEARHVIAPGRWARKLPMSPDRRKQSLAAVQAATARVDKAARADVYVREVIPLLAGDGPRAHHQRKTGVLLPRPAVGKLV
jgi:hypothetical protein